MAKLERLIHECKECIFVAHKDCIHVSNDIIKKALDNDYKPVFINFFTMPNWLGHAAFYAFVCMDCESFSVDYPHGYTGPGYLFLTCQTCEANLVLGSSGYAEIYKRERMAPPPIRQQTKFLEDLRDMWDKIVKNRKT